MKHMDKLSFEYPLIGLLLIVFMISAFLFKPNYTSLYIPHLLSMSSRMKRQWLAPFLKWLGICMLILSLSAPILKQRQEPLQLTHTIMLMIDVSESMNGGSLDANSSANDVSKSTLSGSKFQIAKRVASEFAATRENSNIGVIVFGDFAYVATPLTYDRQSVSTILNGLEEGIAGSMTAMYDALFLGVRLLQKNSAKEKIAILLTDGYNTAGRISLDVALRALESEKIRVYTIGIGQPGEYDKDVLRQIARASDGEFFEANSAHALESVYQKIDHLERSLQRSSAEPLIEHLFIYPLFLAFFSLLGYMFYALKDEL